MTRPVRITDVPNDPPDLDRFVAALLALAIARVEAERERDEGATADPEEEDD